GARRPDPALCRDRDRRRPGRRPGARAGAGLSMTAALPPLLWCADFGSTYTKVALVDTATADLRGTAQHPTTIETDLLDGFEAARAELLARHPDAARAPVAACSSAGGGLRMAVVGNEELVTAEAGRRV